MKYKTSQFEIEGTASEVKDFLKNDVVTIVSNNNSGNHVIERLSNVNRTWSEEQQSYLMNNWIECVGKVLKLLKSSTKKKRRKVNK